MSGDQWLARSDRWFRLLLRLYPVDFRDQMGHALVETYRDRCRSALDTRGLGALFVVWLRALADSVRNGLAERLRPAVSWRRGGLSYVIRADRSPESLIPEVQAVVRRADPRLAVAEVRTMDDIVRNSLRQQRISAVLLAGFALGALLLAGMGLFGVVAAAVTRRRDELAVRLALGAEFGRVLRLVLGDGARLILAGVLIGVPGTWLAGRAVSGTLVGVSPSDPLTLGAVGLGLAVVALAACYMPARRVLGIEPARSLRDA